MPHLNSSLNFLISLLNKNINEKNIINSDPATDIWIFSKSNEKQKNGTSSHDKKENDYQ